MKMCKDCEFIDCIYRDYSRGCPEGFFFQEGDKVMTLSRLNAEMRADWQRFRREAAKDLLVAAIKADDEREVIFEDKNFPCYVRQSIKLADELIKQLREEKE